MVLVETFGCLADGSSDRLEILYDLAVGSAVRLETLRHLPAVSAGVESPGFEGRPGSVRVERFDRPRRIPSRPVLSIS